MPVMRLHCLAPEVKNACVVPVVVDDHWNLGTSTHRKSKWDERPCSIATIDKSLSVEMKEKLKTKLKERYNGLRRYYHARDTRLDWLSDRGSFGMFVLDEVVPTSTCELGSCNVRQWCNKSTALYWAPTAQEIVGQPCSSIPFRCIYKTWFEYHDGSPDIEFQTFLAKPIRITLNGPRTITEIIQAHRSFCDRLLCFLMEHVHSGGAGEERPASLANYNLLLSFRAVVVILDEIAPHLKEDYNYTKSSVFIDREARRQNVLLVLTGDDQGLSAPVDFDSLRSQTLSLGRADVNDDQSFNTIRVSLQTAVRFIADLHRREETAFRDLRRSTINMPTGLTNDSTTTKAGRYADEMIQKAEKEGYNNVFEVKYELEQLQQPDQKELSRDEELQNCPRGVEEYLVELTRPR